MPMLVEKKSLRRFLFVYIVSTYLLLSIGTFFYYKMSYQAVIGKNTVMMKKDLEHFISTNQMKHFLRTGKRPKYEGAPIAIYIDSRYYTGNFEPKAIDLQSEHYVEGNTLYYISKEHKRWGNIHFVTYVNISEALTELQTKLAFFLLFSSLFILVMALILGKIFIRPMKKTIDSLENFIADATHEINTPISNILINIEMSKELYPEVTKSEEYQKIETSAHRISKIFKDLSFVRLNHQEKKNLEVLQINKIVEERIQFFDTLIKNKELKVNIKMEEKEFYMDKEDFIRMVDNLLSNAIKYSPLQGKLSISLNTCLEIRNTGKIQNKENILKKYHRENKAEGGFGLGLYIIQKICIRYSFTFSIENDGEEVIAKICMLTS